MRYLLFAMFAWAASFFVVSMIPMPGPIEPRPAVKAAITQLPQ